MPVRRPGPPVDDEHCRIGATVCSVGWGMVEVAAKVAEIEELEQLGRTLLRGLDDRLAAHAEVRRRGRRGPPWTCSAQHEDTFLADVRGGRICKAIAGTAWSLLVYWHDGESMRVLARGKRRDVDRYAEEVLHYGAPGGPDYTGGDLAWSSWDEEPTLQAATIGGQLRLAPMNEGPHLLMVARNDHRVDVLALGDRDRLQSRAEELLDERRGDSLHLWVGDERVYLQALGFASIVGYVELQRGARLVLGHLEADCFGPLPRGWQGGHVSGHLHAGRSASRRPRSHARVEHEPGLRGRVRVALAGRGHSAAGISAVRGHQALIIFIIFIAAIAIVAVVNAAGGRQTLVGATQRPRHRGQAEATRHSAHGEPERRGRRDGPGSPVLQSRADW
jgi:hypothetical protein